MCWVRVCPVIVGRHERSPISSLQAIPVNVPDRWLSNPINAPRDLLVLNEGFDDNSDTIFAQSKSRNESRSISISKRSPTAVTGGSVADISMPEASISTCPLGSLSTAKIFDGGAAIARCTSNRRSDIYEVTFLWSHRHLASYLQRSTF